MRSKIEVSESPDNPLELNFDGQDLHVVRRLPYEKDVVIGCPYSKRVLGYIPE